MSTSVRISAPADPGLNENPRKAIHWRRGKKATFFYGFEEAALSLSDAAEPSANVHLQFY